MSQQITKDGLADRIKKLRKVQDIEETPSTKLVEDQKKSFDDYSWIREREFNDYPWRSRSDRPIHQNSVPLTPIRLREVSDEHEKVAKT